MASNFKSTRPAIIIVLLISVNHFRSVRISIRRENYFNELDFIFLIDAARHSEHKIVLRLALKMHS